MAVHVFYPRPPENSIQRYVSELFAKMLRAAIILSMRDDDEKNGASPEEEDSGENREFLRETVTNKGASKHRAGKVLWLVLAAVAFGLIASLVFSLARPFFAYVSFSNFPAHAAACYVVCRLFLEKT